MNITVTENSGKHFGQVREGDRILFATPGYYTAGMALKSAECWAAFHGKGNDMGKVTVDLGEVYTARGGGPSGLEYRDVPAEHVATIVAQAYEFGLTVEVKTSTVQGTKYIQVSNGKGSSYGQYHVGAVFSDYALNRRWNETA
jgi:hypothetical protein